MNNESGLKVLLLSFYYEPDLSACSFRTTALVGSLLKILPDNARIELITSLPNRYSTFSSEAAEFQTQGRLTVHRIALSGHNSGMIDQSMAFVGFAKGTLNLVKGKSYDIVFATSSRLMTGALGAYISRKKSVPLYLDIRDIFVDTIKDVLPRKISWFAKPVFSIIERYTVGRARRVNVVSAGFLSYFEKRYPDKKLVVFTNGIDEDFVLKESSEVPRNDAGTLTVVYAGNIGEGQGLHSIVPELSKRFLGRLHFKIIGDGGRIQQLSHSVDVKGGGNIEILPPIKRDELIKFYRSADVLFLHLNDYDAFNKVLPSKLFEYGALGKPIWAGISGYAADFVEENISNAAVFPPCDVDKAEDCFYKLELITQPRPEFVNNFSRYRIMDEMAKDIIEVANE